MTYLHTEQYESKRKWVGEISVPIVEALPVTEPPEFSW